VAELAQPCLLVCGRSSAPLEENGEDGYSRLYDPEVIVRAPTVTRVGLVDQDERTGAAVLAVATRPRRGRASQAR
jgi:hypothetical protein